MVESPEKTTLRACKRLANAISPWLYSVGRPPDALNKLFLAWIDHHRPPTMEQVDAAIVEANQQRAAELAKEKPQTHASYYQPMN